MDVSLPVRECGLKQLDFVRVDIEHESLPVRECGLKRLYLHLHAGRAAVTPRAGVWIETGPWFVEPAEGSVTPRVGVWIETGSVGIRAHPAESLLM